MPGFAVQSGLIEGAEHEVAPAGQDGTAGVGHRRWHLAAWRGVGQRFTQHNVDQLLGRAGELGVNLVDTDECSATTTRLSSRFGGTAASPPTPNCLTPSSPRAAA